eukprot:scaffold17929_cov130-Isochrysis_galbana.AAC.1
MSGMQADARSCVRADRLSRCTEQLLTSQVGAARRTSATIPSCSILSASPSRSVASCCHSRSKARIAAMARASHCSHMSCDEASRRDSSSSLECHTVGSPAALSALARGTGKLAKLSHQRRSRHAASRMEFGEMAAPGLGTRTSRNILTASAYEDNARAHRTSDGSAPAS